MFDIVSLGGATQDVFVRSEGAQVLRVSDRQHDRAWIGFDYGAKIPVETIAFMVGGGATNTAVAFSRLGLRSACAAKVGTDSAGGAVAASLQAAGVNTQLLMQAAGQTGYSVVLTSYEGERSILVFRGVNESLSSNELNWALLRQTRWLYISALSGASAAILPEVLAFAGQHGIQVAWNPGSAQLKLGFEQLSPWLAQVDLLFVNKEEAAALTGLPLLKPAAEHLRQGAGHPVRPGFMYDLDAQLQTLRQQVRQAVVITDGARGTQVYDGQKVWLMPVFPVEVRDVLGAGDAFGAGFTAAWLTQPDPARALLWGSANGAGVVTDPGAHNGLQTRESLQALLAAHAGIQPQAYALSP